MSQKKGTGKGHPFRRRDRGGWRTLAPRDSSRGIITPQVAGLALDGPAVFAFDTSGAVSSLAASISTNFVDDIIIAVVVTDNFVPSGAVRTATVADTAGLTWTLRSRTNGINGTSFSLNQEVWWARAQAPVTDNQVTATFSGVASQRSSLRLFAVSGSPSPNAPWDSNVSLPANTSHMTGVSGAMSQTGTTSSTKSMLFGFAAYAANAHPLSTDPAGFTAFADQLSDNSLLLFGDNKLLAAAGSNTVSWGNNQDFFQLTVDALTGDNPNAVTGTATTSLTASSQSLSGTVSAKGTITTSLTKASIAAVAKEIFTGTAATNLTKASIAAAGWAEIIGTATTNLSKMSIAALAATERFIGTITTNLTKASFAAVGKEVFTGTITTHLTKASIAAVAKEIFTGTVNTALSKVSMAATDTEIFTGTITTRLTKASIAAAGKEVFTGTINTALTKASISASGSTNVTGTATTNLARIAQIVSGHEGISIDGAIVTTLGPASFAASAQEIMLGAAVTRLGGINMSSAGLEIITGVAVTRLGNENGQMVGNVVIAEEIIQGPIVMALPGFRPLILGAKLGSPGTSKWYSWRYTDR